MLFIKLNFTGMNQKRKRDDLSESSEDDNPDYYSDDSSSQPLNMNKAMRMYFKSFLKSSSKTKHVRKNQ